MENLQLNLRGNSIIKSKALGIVALALIVLTLGVSFTSAQITQNWAMFRHDLQHTGVYAVSDSDGSGPNSREPIWTYQARSEVLFSPVIANGKVYGASSSQLFCVDAISGSEVWTMALGPSNVAGEITVTNSTVYVGSVDNYLNAVNANTGALIWRSQLGWIPGAVSVSDNRIFLGAHNNVFCLDIANGNPLWNFTTGLYVPSIANVIAAVYASVMVSDGKVYAAAQDGNLYCLNASQGSELWRFATGDLTESAPAIVNGRLYFGSNDKYLYCLDAITGDLIWKYLAGGRINSNPSVIEGKVYFGSNDDNTIYCVDSLTGAKVWSYRTNGDVYASPAVAYGRVYVGSADHNFYVIDANHGTLAWKYTTGGAIYSSAVIANAKVYFGSNDNKLYAFGRQYITSVNAGDWFQYSVSTTGDVPGELKGINGFILYVDNVDLTRKVLTCHRTNLYVNGTQQVLPSYQTNVETGTINPDYNAPQITERIGILATRLSAGDPVHDSASLSSYKINDTISTTSSTNDHHLLKILSDSMAPALPKGNIILVDTNVNASDLKSTYPDSDIIVFHNPNDTNQLIVHRIVAKGTDASGTISYQVKGDANGPNKWPSPIQPSDYSPLGPVTSDLIVGKVAMTFGGTGYIPNSPINHASFTENSTGTDATRYEFYNEQDKGNLVLALLVHSTSENIVDYTVASVLVDSHVSTGSILPALPITTDHTLGSSLTMLAYPSPATVKQAAEVTALGSGIIAFAYAGSFLTSKIGAVLTSANSEAPSKLSKAFTDFLKKLFGKHYERLSKKKKPATKSKLVTSREIAVLFVSILITAFVLAFVAIPGYPNSFTLSEYSIAFFAAFISAAIVQSISFLADKVNSRKSIEQKQLSFWRLGTVTLFITGLIAKTPFSSPTITQTIGEIARKNEKQRKIAALKVAIKALMLLPLLIPFALLWSPNGPNAGTMGLIATSILICATVAPIPPLAGKDLYAYKHRISILTSILSAALVILVYLNAIPLEAYIIIGTIALIGLPITLKKLSMEQKTLTQVKDTGMSTN
jgi:signal peptidase I